MTQQMSSRISGFYKLSLEQKIEAVRQVAGLSPEDVSALTSVVPPAEKLQHLSENVIGAIGIPLGIATNFLINGRDVLVPMATDESSVIAAASNGARMARVKGGFSATSTEPVMAVQIQVGCKGDPEQARKKIDAEKQRLIQLANTRSSTLPKMGAGAKDIQMYVLPGFFGPMLMLRLLVDVRDAMGANVVNTMAEFIAPEIERITGETVYLKVVDNYAIERTATAKCVVDKDALGGEAIVDRFLQGYSCAYHDLHRACGHNKGVMNGITAVVLATGNDTRAMEAGCHAYACRSGVYRPLPVWGKNSDGDLTGELTIPVAVGTIGGLTKAHPVAAACLKVMGVQSARELGEILACVGLASKCAAERALADEGIQQGHMAMHSANIAIMAGAKQDEIGVVADRMVAKGSVNLKEAQVLLEQLRRG